MAALHVDIRGSGRRTDRIDDRSIDLGQIIGAAVTLLSEIGEFQPAVCHDAGDGIAQGELPERVEGRARAFHDRQILLRDLECLRLACCGATRC